MMYQLTHQWFEHTGTTMGQPYRVVDLFCGCGGLSRGLELAGFEIAWAADNWAKAIAVYRDNFDHRATVADVSQVFDIANKIRPLKVDGIVGGPPCQDFSSAGKRQEGDRADLTKNFADIIAAVSPQFFIMENVARARSSAAYERASEYLRDAGYGLTEVVLDASRCGVPQKRKRFFCVGILGVDDGFLDNIFQSRQTVKELTVREYLGDELGLDYYYRHPRNYSRRAIYSLDEPAATVRGVNRPVPDGYPGHRADAAKRFPGLRSLSTAERARIQTFPAGFVWDAAKTHLELMIGNAVPVNLARFVGECVKIGLESFEANETQNNRMVG